MRERPATLLSRRGLLVGLWRLLLAGGAILSPGGARAARQARELRVSETIAAVIDRMLPAEDLPGARALGIDRQIISQADPKLRRDLAAGVAWLDGRARRSGAADFLGLDEARQDAVLRAAFASTGENAPSVVWLLRDLSFTAYYTHSTVIGAFAYAGSPQPAGFPDFEEPPR